LIQSRRILSGVINAWILVGSFRGLACERGVQFFVAACVHYLQL
jgi:hypothetical protein